MRERVAGRGRWAALAVGVVVLCVLTYVVVSGLSAEYGGRVIEPSTFVVVALLAGAVVAAAAYRGGPPLAPPRRATVAAIAGVVAAGGVLIATGAGRASGGAQHAQRQQAVAESCRNGADRTTIAFAREAGRIISTNDRLANSGASGCGVSVAIDKRLGNDPLALIDAAVADDGWQRDGEAAWVDDNGFRVEARVDPPLADEAEHSVVVVECARTRNSDGDR